MKKDDLRMQLAKYPVPEPDLQKKALARKRVLEKRVTFHMTDWQFFTGQLGFIRFRTWAGQLLVLAAICYACRNLAGQADMGCTMLSTVSAMTPLLFVFHIEELVKVCFKSTLEIEMAAKYSLKKLVLSRICILGMVDMVILGILILFLSAQLKIQVAFTALYCLVPVNITVIGPLYLLRLCVRGAFGYAALAYTAMVCAAFMAIPVYRPVIYSRDAYGLWVLVFFLSMGLLVKKLLQIWKEMGIMDNFLPVEQE